MKRKFNRHRAQARRQLWRRVLKHRAQQYLPHILMAAPGLLLVKRENGLKTVGGGDMK